MAESLRFGSELIELDGFQNELLQMANNASKEQLSLFFKKNYKPFFQFLLKLYITSLQYDHPDRGRNNPQKNDKRNKKETSIISQWSNILTTSPKHSPTTHGPSATMTLLDISNTETSNINATADDSNSNNNKSSNIYCV